MGRFPRQPARDLARQRADGGAGHPHSDGDDIVADDGVAVGGHSEAVSASEVAPVGAGRRRTRREPRRAQAFGAPVNTYYNLANAKMVVSLDSDFLASGPASLRYARQFAARRRVRGNQTEMNRLYVVEPMPTPTGAKADHRLPLRAGDIEEFAWALATGLGAANGPKQGENHDIYKWIGAIARDLQNNKGASLVIAGEQQPPIVHALAHVMNASLGNVGKTVFYTDPIEANPVDQLASLQDLVKDLDAGAVDLLLIIGGNPVFTSPVEMGMRDRIQKARLRAHLSLFNDETSEVCQWHLPEAHYLETWGDARAFDGTATIQQPLIQPLYNGRSGYQIAPDAHGTA